MPRKFFSAARNKATLEQDIQTHIALFKTLAPEDPAYITQLHAIQRSLTALTRLSEYISIKPTIKRAVTLNLRKIEREIQLFEALEDDVECIDVPECYIQIPSSNDIAYMVSMPAGADEDQKQRIMHMTEQLQAHPSSIPIISTSETTLPDYWQNVFKAINAGQHKTALLIFSQIPAEDSILQALLAVHPQDYLKELITYSIQALKTGIKKLNADIILTPKTFEVLIKDLATTLFNPAKICFSFGLPTHHAYSNTASGFCLINKTAVLMSHLESSSEESISYLVIGTDVNRDNGLCQILRSLASHLPICHIDVFDSRVYPKQRFSDISDEFNSPGTDVGQKIRCWQQDNFKYYAVDLSQTPRRSPGIHPALNFALQKINEQIEKVQSTGQKIMLLLPTGWDSHEDETAFCGKVINDRRMSPSEAQKTRFNDSDLSFFYEQLCQIYNKNKDHIAGIYWGLEGGYDRKMYERQIQLMQGVISDSLVLESLQTSSSHNPGY